MIQSGKTYCQNIKQILWSYQGSEKLLKTQFFTLSGYTKLLFKKYSKYFCNHVILQYFKTVIVLQLKLTWNNLAHFYIRLTKLILKQQLSNTACFNIRVWNRTSSTPVELSPCLSPVIIICSLPRWLWATIYHPPRLTSGNTNSLWSLICCAGKGGQKQKLHAGLDNFWKQLFPHAV